MIWDGVRCDYGRRCDPFVKLFINDTLQFVTPTRTNECCFDLGITNTTEKIFKSSLVKIEVWDADDGNHIEKLIFRTEGNIESFLTVGRSRVELLGTENIIDTISFWQDEYEYGIE